MDALGRMQANRESYGFRPADLGDSTERQQMDTCQLCDVSKEPS